LEALGLRTSTEMPRGTYMVPGTYGLLRDRAQFAVRFSTVLSRSRLLQVVGCGCKFIAPKAPITAPTPQFDFLEVKSVGTECVGPGRSREWIEGARLSGLCSPHL
jgi:hypothetical protein